MGLRTLVFSGAILALLASGCGDSKAGKNSGKAESRSSKITSPEQIASETKALNDWFADRFKENLARSPMSRTYLGIKTDYDKLDDVSQAALDEEFAAVQEWAKQRRAKFNIDHLDSQAQVSYRLADYDAVQGFSEKPFENHNYIFDHMSGPHTEFPTFMINAHRVENEQDALDYIERLNASQRYMGQYQARAEAQYKQGIQPPKFD